MPKLSKTIFEDGNGYKFEVDEEYDIVNVSTGETVVSFFGELEELIDFRDFLTAEIERLTKE